MSKKPTNRPNSPDAAKAQRAQIFGFVAGALIVLLLAGFAVKRTTAKNSEASQTAPAAMAEPVSEQPAQAVAAVPQPDLHGEFTRISVDELKKIADSGAVTIIDVRDMDSYLASHIKGAIHIPVARLEGEIPYLPKDKPIVTYCTCPAEESSGTGAQILQHGGFAQVAALQGGMQAWVEKGFATASGAS